MLETAEQVQRQASRALLLLVLAVEVAEHDLVLAVLEAVEAVAVEAEVTAQEVQTAPKISVVAVVVVVQFQKFHQPMEEMAVLV
jgi:hypothetical protein